MEENEKEGNIWRRTPSKIFMAKRRSIYTHFEYVLLVSLGIVVMAIHFLSLKLVLASVDLRTKTASLIWLQFIFRGFLWSFNAHIMVPLEDFF